MARKTLILHAGYHETGAGLIRRWLEDHAEVLAPHLGLILPGPEGSDALRAAAQALGRGRSGARAALAEEARALATRVRAAEAPVVCLSDEGLLGLPLGAVEAGQEETGIYPGLCPILDVLAEAWAGFDLVVALFERGPEAWLRNLHARARRESGFTGPFETFLARYDPAPHWPDLRDEITFALDGRGRLETWAFEVEFRGGQVAGMGFFRLLGLPGEVLAQCRPGLVPPAEAPEPETRAAAAPPPPGPPVLLLGGPNALVPGGWGALLAEYPALAELRNLSGGACTSAMALYRLLAEGEEAPGAPVIWEQGITEYTHQAGGQPLESLLYHVEWLLQLCQRGGRPFVPVLMQGRAQVAQPHEGTYLRGLRALLADYGVVPVDCARLIAVLARGAVDLDAWYERNAFYRTDTEFPRRLAETVLTALGTARVPQAPPARAAHFDGRTLVLRTPAETPGVFSGPKFAFRFAPFEEAPRVETPGRALAAILVASGSGPSVSFRAGDTRHGPYVTQVPHGPGIAPQQLRQLVLGSAPGGVEIPGGVVQIDVDDSQDTPIVQTMYSRGAYPPEPVPSGLVALLCEEPQEAPGMTRFPQPKDIDS